MAAEPSRRTLGNSSAALSFGWCSGDKGERIKRIGQEARKDMETMFDSKVMLNLWVKVKGGWSDDERALRSLGYLD